MLTFLRRAKQIKPLMWLAGVVGVFALGMLTTAFVHYSRTVADNERLRGLNTTLETSVELQGQTIDRQAAAIDAWAEHAAETARRIDDLAIVGREAREETRRLNEIFRQHDLGGLAAARPGLIERRINSATADTFRMLECATGARGPDC